MKRETQRAWLGLGVVSLAVVTVPMLVIWCINTLFLTNIPFTAKTWVAMLILLLLGLILSPTTKE